MSISYDGSAGVYIVNFNTSFTLLWEILLVWVCFKLLDWLWLKLRPALGHIVEYERKFWARFVPYLGTAVVVGCVMSVALLCRQTAAKPETALTPVETKFEIVRVFLQNLHEVSGPSVRDPRDYIYHGVYIVFREGKNKELVPFYFPPHKFKTWLYEDVPPSEPMYVKFTNSVVNYWEDKMYCEIHIHSRNELNGVGWDHGKGHHGQMSLVE